MRWAGPVLVFLVVLSGCSAPQPAPAAVAVLAETPPGAPVAAVADPELLRIVDLKHDIHELDGLARDGASVARLFRDGDTSAAEFDAVASDILRSARMLPRRDGTDAAVASYNAALDIRLAHLEGLVACGREGRVCEPLADDALRASLASRSATENATRQLRARPMPLSEDDWTRLWALRHEGVTFAAAVRSAGRAIEAYIADPRAEGEASFAVSAFWSHTNATMRRVSAAGSQTPMTGDVDRAWERGLGEARRWIADAHTCLDAEDAQGSAACARTRDVAGGEMGLNVVKIADEYGPMPLSDAEAAYVAGTLGDLLRVEVRFVGDADASLAVWRSGVRSDDATLAILARSQTALDEVVAASASRQVPDRFLDVDASWQAYLRSMDAWFASARDCIAAGDRACPAAVLGYETSLDRVSATMLDLAPFVPS